MKRRIQIKDSLVFRNDRAWTEGWGLFSTDTGLEIQRIDDPSSTRPEDCECDNTHEQNRTCCQECWEKGFRLVAPDSPEFESDLLALAFVIEKARGGSKYHRRAIAMVAGIQ